MNGKTKAALREYLIRWEAFSDWVYLDTVGVPTIGIGLALQGEGDASWFGQEGIDAWKTVRESPTGMYFTWYQHRSPWRADSAKLEALFMYRLQATENALQKQFPGWATWPQSAQIAIFDLAWNVGANITPHWPRLTAALKEQDWEEAALQCSVTHGVVARNIARVALLNSLLVVDSAPTTV